MTSPHGLFGVVGLTLAALVTTSRLPKRPEGHRNVAGQETRRRANLSDSRIDVLLEQMIAVRDLRMQPDWLATDSLGSGMEWEQPWGIASAPGGGAVVLDVNARAIYLLGNNGRAVRRMGQSGRGPGEFILPTSMVLVGDSIYVWDQGQRRMTKFASSGSHLSDAVSPASGDVSRLSWDPIIGLIAQLGPRWRAPPDSLNGRSSLVQLGSDGRIKRTITAWRDSLSNVAIVTRNRSSVAAVPFAAHWSWAPSGRGTIYVTDGQEYLIREVSPDGRMVYSIKSEQKSLPITRRERDSVNRKVATYSEDLRRQARVPSRKPAIEELMVSDDGCLWVRTHDGDSLGVQSWDVRAPSGVPIARVLLPIARVVRAVSDKRVFFIEKDSLDVQTVGAITHGVKCSA